MLYPTISIIIPVHNGDALFQQCLASVKALEPAPAELVVVVDGDCGQAREHAEAAGATVIAIPERAGPARARNLGAELTRSDILFFVDSDVALPPDALNDIMMLFGQEPDLTALIGSYDDEPGAPDFLSQYRNLLHHFVHQTGDEEASTFWGACGAIRRSAFFGLGGFDEAYRYPSIEDIELGYRLKQAGYRIRLHKSLQVKHLKRWDPLSVVKTDFFHRALPWTELILRDSHFVNDLNLRVSSRASVALTFLLLGATAGALRWPSLVLVMANLMAALVLLNRSFYHFLLRNRGLGFTLSAIPWHWFYFFYSGLAFCIVLSGHLLSQISGSGGTGVQETRKIQIEP
jgi:glycosyltransferase involved in cell wall biosynthesis